MTQPIWFTCALIFLTQAATAQTYDEARHRLYEQEQQSAKDQAVQRFQSQNSVMQNAASIYAASRGESVASGPSCQTINDSEPIMSYWPASLALRAQDTYKSTAFRKCDFTTSGGSLCKSHFTVSHAQLAAEVDCVTPQQRDERYIVVGHSVHAITARDNLWGAEPPIRARSRQRLPQASGRTNN